MAKKFTVHIRRNAMDGQVLGSTLYESDDFQEACNEARRLDQQRNAPGLHAIRERETGHIFWDVDDSGRTYLQAMTDPGVAEE